MVIARTVRSRACAGAVALVSVLGVLATSRGADAAAAAPSVRAACGSAPAGFARCFAQYAVPDAAGTASPDAAQPVRPRDIQAAYDLPAGGGAGMTVGIVDAFDNPKAASDLTKFRARYHLPACTVASGCFRKVNQAGDASPPPQRDPEIGRAHV